MSRGRFGALSATALLALVVPLAGQAPADRLALRIFRDSLSIQYDSVELRAAERRMIAVARVRRDSTLLHLRLGFLALRLGDVTGRTAHYEDAGSEFEWAIDLHSDWPYPWLGLGLAEARLPDKTRTPIGGLFMMVGQDRDRLAGDAFRRAVQLDPGFTEGMIEFAQTVLDQRIEAPLDQAIRALRGATATPVAWDPELLLLLGRLERRAGNPDSARLDFSRAATLSFHPGVARLELARTLPLTADTIAPEPGAPTPVEAAYFAAAASDDPDVVQMIRRDIEPIVDDSTLMEFDAAHGAARVEWLRRFWAIRDGLDLRPPGSRLAEHYRRWQVATRDFHLSPLRRRYRYGVELYRSGDQEFDDRGVVWLRQGAPTARIVWPQALRRPNLGDAEDWGDETWRYARPDGDLVLHFAAHDDPDDYHLVESISNLGMTDRALEEHAAELPGLNRMLHSGPNTRSYLEEEERLRSRRSMAIATTSDSWVHVYDRFIPGRAQWFAVGAEGTLPLVHIVFAVDATAIRRIGGHRSTIPVTVRAVLVDSLGVPLARLDTVEFARVPDSTARFVAMRSQLAVPPGTFRVQLGVELTPKSGSLYPSQSIRVPQIDGSALDLSALVIGPVDHGLPWAATPADTAWFDGGSAYAPGDTIVVYAEAYGIRPGASYTTRLAITRRKGLLSRLLTGKTEVVTLGEARTFPDALGRIRRVVALNGLPTGDYVVELSIEGEGGRVSRRAGMTIRPEEAVHPAR